MLDIQYVNAVKRNPGINTGQSLIHLELEE